MNQIHPCSIRWMMLLVFWSFPAFQILAKTAATSTDIDVAPLLTSVCTDPDACNYAVFDGPAYCLQIDTYASHTTGPLAGSTTYRVYALCENTDDFVNSVTGDSDTPIHVSTTTTFYQNMVGADLGQNIQPALLGFFPELAYDSWITIGLVAPAVTSAGEASVSTIGNTWLPGFSAGGNLVINDEIGGGWFVVPGAENGIAGDDYRVLLGQFTTDGDLSGELYIQYFPHGEPADYVRITSNFADACSGPEVDAGCIYAEEGYTCDGNCINDADGDGVCDALEIAGCQDEAACNYNSTATDAGDCTYAATGYDCDGNCLNDADGDGVCDEFEIAGCQDETACNYDSEATDASDCTYAESGYDCEGACINDADGDGICDEFEVVGCQDEAACNYGVPGGPAYCLQVDAYATHTTGALAGSTTYRVYALCENTDDFVNSVTGDSDTPIHVSTTTSFYQNPVGSDLGQNIQPALLGFFPELAYDSWITIGLEGPAVTSAGEESVSTIGNTWLPGFSAGGNLVINDDIGGGWFVVPGAENGIAGDDYRVLLGQFTTDGALSGELYIQFFPHGEAADYIRVTTNFSDACLGGDADCVFADEGYDCDGNCINDADGDGLCDEFEIAGCQDETACNFDSTATDAGDCNYAATGYDCNGNCLNDADGDGVCDEFEVAGCQDAAACNFDAAATDDDGSCTYAETGYNCDGNCINDADGDGICDEFEVVGCQDETACNYDSSATDSGDCTYPAAESDCDGNCINDADADGVCDEFEVVGCQDISACNYDSSATDAGDCTYAETGYDCDGNCITDADADGVCDEFEVSGCQDISACNYDSSATDAGDCTYAETGYDCDGNCLNDADGDGVCDEFEIGGCTDAEASNFDASATDEDGSCEYPACNDEAACNYEAWSGTGYCLFVDPYVVHDGTSGSSALIGKTTYRVYAVCENADDFVSSVSGDAEFPTTVATTTSFYQDAFGTNLGSNINPALFTFFPDLQYDSWVTIGLDGPANSSSGEGAVNTAGSSWLPNFEQGGNLEISDALGGSWFVVNGSTNGVAGDDGKVLLGQFTTDGDLTGQLYVQFFQHGEPAQELRTMIDLADACTPLDFSSCVYPDAGYDCDGACITDTDGDGVCDDFELPGCNDVAACNFDETATDLDDSCIYPAAGLDCDGNCINDADGDGVCDEFEVVGCQDDTACNYDSSATDPGDCTIADTGYDCDGNCLTDTDGDGICDEFEVFGCTDALACNFDLNATELDDSCSYPAFGYDCDGNCINDADGDGVCDEFEVVGCQDDTACNYDSAATDAGDCTYAETGYDCDGNCINDADGDGVCDEFEVVGCQDDTACNYDSAATDAGDCTYAETGYDCDGVCLNDADGDGVCDEFEIVGCQDDTACNYDSAATDAGDCTYAETSYDCDGNCINDADGDGVCDEFEVVGCQDDTACNYDSAATDAGDCTYAEAGYDCDGNCINDADGDGVCDEFEVVGCQDDTACNYDSSATDGGDCTYAETGYDCDGNCLVDTDGDGVCDPFEIEGCTDAAACNFDTSATDENGSCSYAETGYDCDGNCLEDTDGDGVCDPFEIAGCTDAMACNFDEQATDYDGSCIYAELEYDCEGNCLLDSDGDGICDPFEVPGCTDITACNFNELATDEDGSCTFPEMGFDCNGDPLPCEACFAVFEPSLVDQIVACADELPTEPWDVSATGFCTGDDLEVTSFVANLSDGVVVNQGTTAYGSGPDAAIRINGLAAQGLSPTDLWFEDGPLEVKRFSNGTALVTGVVRNNLDSDLAWEVHMVFEDELPADEFLALNPYHGLITAYGCAIDSANLATYVLKDDQSYLQGIDGYAGSHLALSHMPMSTSRRFQVGYGGNGHNCQYGMGGWFSWDGEVDGTSVFGLIGDLVIDLGADAVTEPTACGQEAVDVYYTAFDPTCNLYWNSTQHFEVEDLEAPIYLSGAEDMTVACEAVPPVATADDFEWADGCSSAAIDLVYLGETATAGSCSNESVITRSWIASDCSGNTTEHTQTITVQDNLGPVFTDVSSDLYFSCEEVVVIQEPIVTDNCDGVVTLTSTTVADAGSCPGSSLQIVTWTATDACGNTSIAQQTIHIEDNTAPIFINTAAFVEAPCGDLSEITAEAIDNCGEVTLTYEDETVAGGCIGNSGTVLRTWMAEDGCNNISFFTQTIELTDNVAPSIELSCADDVILEAGSACEADTGIAAIGYPPFLIEDNCAATTTSWEIHDSPAVYTCSGFSFDRTYALTATDACGNSENASCTQTITVLDVAGPELTIACPANITIELDQECDANLSTEVTGMATALAEDACEGLVVALVDYEDSEPVITCNGSFYIERTFTASAADGCGNEADPVSCVQVITVVDLTPPIFEPYPLTVNVECSAMGDPEALDFMPLAANDGCSSDIEYAVSSSFTPNGCLGTWTRVWTATDACGNIATAEQQLALFDNTAPSIAVPSNVTAYFDSNGNWGVAIDADATDNCSTSANGTLTLTFVDAQGIALCATEDATAEGNMEVLRTWTATDDCGNTSTATTAIAVLDTIAPVLQVSTVSVECSEYLEATDWGGWSVVDNVDSDVHVTWSDLATGPNTGCHTIIRSFIATDDCGNSASMQQTIVVEDNTPPTFTSVPSNQEESCQELPYEYTAIDACSEVTYSEVRIPVIENDGCGNYSDLVTITATDACGNVASAQFTIVVADHIAPAFAEALPENVNVACDNVPEAATLTAIDNCDTEAVVTYSQQMTEGDCPQSYTLTRTWVATDCAGNSTSHTQVVTVDDNIPPVIIKDDSILEISCEVYHPDSAYAYAIDNCDADIAFSWTDTWIPGGCGLGGYLRDYMAVDACSNPNQISQIIWLTDTIAPVFTWIPADTLVSCEEPVPSTLAVAEDNCSAMVNVTYVDAITNQGTAGNFTILRTFEAVDDCGNSITQTQSIQVVDTVAPVFDAEPGDLIVTYEAWAALNIMDYAPTFGDGCDANASIAYAIDTLAFTCNGTFEVEITYTVTDASGNSASVSHTASITDAAEPEFIDVPEYMTVSCDVDVPFAWAVAVDDATEDSDLVYAYVDDINESNCSSVYQIVRTFTVNDACGNSNFAVQLIDVNDTTAPALTGSCEASNGETIALCFDSYSGAFTVPEACSIEAADNCDSDTDVVFEETTVPALGAGYDLTLGYCTASTPAPLSNSNACNSTSANNHSLVIPGFGTLGGATQYDNTSGTIAHLDDGSLVLTQTVVATNNLNAGWTLVANFTPEYSWSQWLALPGAQSFSYPCGQIVDDHLNWSYHVMTAGTLTGWGDYAGSTLNLAHAPANNYYGMQVGFGANGKNSGYGYTTLFTWSGTFNGAPASGSGTLFGDMDCTQPISISRNYTATDCAGNASTFEYTYVINSTACLPDPPCTGIGCEDTDPGTPPAGMGTGSVGIHIRALQPNPALDLAFLNFVLDKSSAVTVHLCNSMGASIAEQFTGTVEADVPQSVTLHLEGLEAGMYYVTIQSEEEIQSIRLMLVN